MLRKVWSSSYRSSVSFQILSDLHLEVNQQYSSYEIPACAEYLILAGDIGRLTDYNDYRNFLQKQTDRFRSVFLLLGNHEFYNETFDTGIEMAKQLEEDPAFDGRLIVLHQKRYDVPGSNVSILGCTLWSKVPQERPKLSSQKWKIFKEFQTGRLMTIMHAMVLIIPDWWRRYIRYMRRIEQWLKTVNDGQFSL